MKVSIVIPNWNGEEKVRRHLPNVLKVKGVDEVIVVDDASSDNSVEVIKTHFPQITLIAKKNNTRFADTVNLGVKNAKADLVFVLNNDASPEPDCVQNALKHFNNKDVFSVSCSVEGSSWSWARFDRGFFWHYQNNNPVFSKDSHQTLWSSGGSGIFRKDLWDKFGGFDTIYSPFYEEDVDLGYRATKRGYKNIFEPKSKVEHYKEKGVNKEHFSEQMISKVAQRNQLLFIWKNITSDTLTRQHQAALIKMVSAHPKYFEIVSKALTRLPKALQKRKIEKKEQQISDEEIFEMFQP